MPEEEELEKRAINQTHEMTGLGHDEQQPAVPASASDSTTTSIERGVTGDNNGNQTDSHHIPRRARCCCGRQDCAYLKHNDDALGALERDLETAARLGQVCGILQHHHHEIFFLLPLQERGVHTLQKSTRMCC